MAKEASLPASGNQVWNEEPPEEGQIFGYIVLLMRSDPAGVC